ncbi:polysialyltransferase family glycosyltransferase [Cryomorphaceae bacterium 1068]|nr:polysialyltransferase family glycosyltransferase [Cryomorphaceae bacterium 1068]
MRHVFYLHSHITAIVCQGVIDHLNLSEQQVQLILQSNYANQLPSFFDKYVKKICGVLVHKKSKTARIGRKVRPLLESFYLDRQARKITPVEDYTLYLPQDKISLFRYLIFQPYCVKYYYIEEGLSCYDSSNFGEPKVFHPKNVFTKNLLPLGGMYKGQYLYNRFPGNTGAYALGKEAFPNEMNVCPITVEIPENYKVQLEAGNLFIFGALMRYGMIPKSMGDKYFQCVLSVLKKKSFYVKFHPNQEEEEIKEIKYLMKMEGIRYQEIPTDCVLEYELMSKRISVYGFVSSLLFYNQILGSGESFSAMNSVYGLLTPESQRIVGRTKEIFLRTSVELL